ncbi:MAG: MipA/OmpV family protein [Rhodanobacter sp.]
MNVRSLPVLFALVAISSVAHADADSTSSFSTESTYLGGGVAYVPRYAGSKEYRAAGVFDASAMFKNGIFVDGTQGVGYRFKFSDQFYATAAVGMDPGRTDKNDFARPGADFLKGMGDIKAAALASIGMGFRFNDRSDVSLMASKAVGHAYGTTLHVMGHVVAWKGDNDSIDLNGAVHYGNGDYNQTYFGVSTVQSQRTGFAHFTPGSGIYAVTASATWTHQLSAHWITRVSAGATRYMHSVVDSPVVQDKLGYIVGSSIDYRF